MHRELLFERAAANEFIAGEDHPHAQPMSRHAMNMMIGHERCVVVFRVDGAVFQQAGGILHLRYCGRSWVWTFALIVDDMVGEKFRTRHAAQNKPCFPDSTRTHTGSVLIVDIDMEAGFAAPKNDVHLSGERELLGGLAVPGYLDHFRGVEDNLTVSVRHRIGVTAAGVEVHGPFFVAQFNVAGRSFVLDGDGISIAPRGISAPGHGDGYKSILQGHGGCGFGDRSWRKIRGADHGGADAGKK